MALKHAGDTYTEAAAPQYRARADQSSGRYRREGLRQLGSADADQGRRRHLCGRSQHRAGLAWISYWNYGDYNPISHHLCAFPSADPTTASMGQQHPGRQEFLIYGIPTNIETPAEGFNIYRVRYDGAQME